MTSQAEASHGRCVKNPVLFLNVITTPPDVNINCTKVFLIPQAPLTSALSASPASPLSVLRASRSRYVELLQERLRAPDGSYEDGFSFPGQDEASAQIRQKAGNWEQNNPLSLDEKVRGACSVILVKS